MHDLSLKSAEAGDIGPRDVIELPSSGNEHICCVLECLPGGEVSNFDLPVAR